MLLPAAALAAPRCAPLPELAFRADLLDLRTALELDRPATHEALVDRLVRDVPCLGFAVQDRLWAELLVHVALREFAAGRDWQAPLAAALRLHPSLDRGVGPGHPMAAFEPPADPPPDGVAAPSDRLWFVDGTAALTLPRSGLHLVQATDGRWWGSAATWSGALEDGWLEAPIHPPPHLAGWVRAGVFAGGSLGRQAATPRAADWFPTASRPSPAAAIAASGRVAAWSPVGLGAEVRAPLARDAWPEGRALVTSSVGRAALGAGAGAVLAGVRLGEGPPERVWLPYPAVSGEAALAGPRRALDLRATAGGWSSVATGTVEAAWGPSGAGPAWRLLARADGAAARFRQLRTPVRIEAAVWSVGVGVGLAARSDP